MQHPYPTRQIPVSRIPRTGKVVDFAATGTELEALAAELGVLELYHLNCSLQLAPWRKDGLHVSGRMTAGIVQQCVASLEPFETALELDIERYFVQEGDPARGKPVFDAGELVLDPDNEDEPDVIENDRIDLWAIALEELNLAIDPFPRKQGYEIGNSAQANEDTTDPDQQRPFASLGEQLAKKNPQDE